MKKLLVIFLFMGFMISQAKADTTVQPTIINAAEDLETGFYEYFPVTSPYIGNGGGVAYEFDLTQPTDVTSIFAPVDVTRGLDGHTPVIGTTPATLTLFSGSSNEFHGVTFPDGGVIPNIGNTLLTENFTAIGTNTTSLITTQDINDPTNYTNEGISGLNLNLQPGDYWVGLEGGSDFTYYQPSVTLGVAATPEPSTWIYFGLVMLLVFFRGYYSRKALVQIRKG